MSHTIIDRRRNEKGKSSDNRQKFIRRAKKQVKDAVKGYVRDGKVADASSTDSKKINIPVKDLNEPEFHHDSKSGRRDHTHPGNKEFVPGDEIKKPSGGGSGSGSGEASDSGEGEDNFEFHLTREEFLDLFFEDLELPDMIKRQIKTVDHYENKRAGFSTDGTPARLNLIQTMRQAKSRRIGLFGGKKKALSNLEEELETLQNLLEQQTLEDNNEEAEITKEKILLVEEKIKSLKSRYRNAPFIDDVDLRYNRWERKPVPATQAVMYCIMDVSASMQEWEKEMAKSFFMLMYLFLFKEYKKVDIIYIRHHSTARVVDEEEFFYAKDSGGTIVSSGLKEMIFHIKENYPLDQWNIYGCQCSDGDNFHSDLNECQEALRTILKIVQYYAYVEVRKEERPTDLWKMYGPIDEQYEHFSMQKVTDAKEIYPVFRKLFEKR